MYTYWYLIGIVVALSVILWGGLWLCSVIERWQNRRKRDRLKW